MPILLKTEIERTAKTPVTARRARVGSLCGFPDTAERVPAKHQKTGRCASVRERWKNVGTERARQHEKSPSANARNAGMGKIEGF